MRAPEFLETASARVGPALEAWLPAADEPPARLHAAMRHLLLPGGKRLRPALCFAASIAAGGTAEAALAPAAAVEVLHAYTLIHDDLPCMDDDDERRGLPTVHRLYGEATALLAGDALQALAFSLLAREGEAEPAVRADAIARLAHAAGSQGLAGGQWDDLNFASAAGEADAAGTAVNFASATGGEASAAGEAGAAQLESIHRRKTAALFAAAAALGARFGGASAAAAAEFAAFGAELGVAFQLADDLLDAQSDAARAALSAVRVLGEARTREHAEAALARALSRVAAFGARAETLRALAHFCVHRKL